MNIVMRRKGENRPWQVLARHFIDIKTIIITIMVQFDGAIRIQLKFN